MTPIDKAIAALEVFATVYHEAIDWGPDAQDTYIANSFSLNDLEVAKDALSALFALRAQQSADKADALRAAVRDLALSLAEVREIYVGTEGGEAETCYEGYLLQEQKKMYQEAVDTLKKHAAIIAECQEGEVASSKTPSAFTQTDLHQADLIEDIIKKTSIPPTDASRAYIREILDYLKKESGS